jgi:hypothetical protein
MAPARAILEIKNMLIGYSLGEIGPKAHLSTNYLATSKNLAYLAI